MYIINGNYGNDTIALMQWCFETKRSNVTVVSIDTGFAAPQWAKRVIAGEAFAKQLGFDVVRLKPDMAFDILMKKRRQFPSPKFHWCATYLKALPFLDWIDTVDPECASTVLIAKRQEGNRQETIVDSENYQGRTVWYPLMSQSLAMRDALIQRAGFEILATRSLECEACIYNQARDFAALSDENRQRLAILERELGKPMFSPKAYGGAEGIAAVVEWVKAHPTETPDDDTGNGERGVYYQGCGSEFACGL